MWLFFAFLSTLMWALVNVLDSLIVRNYEKNPFVLMWCQSFFSIIFLAIFPLFVPVQFSSWTLSLLLFGAYAYEIGAISLVSIVANVQPFMVIGLAWFFMKLLPSRAPRELLTMQSVQIKFLSFTVVFAGLTLLAVG